MGLSIILLDAETHTTFIPTEERKQNDIILVFIWGFLDKSQKK